MRRILLTCVVAAIGCLGCRTEPIIQSAGLARRHAEYKLSEAAGLRKKAAAAGRGVETLLNRIEQDRQYLARYVAQIRDTESRIRELKTREGEPGEVQRRAVQAMLRRLTGQRKNLRDKEESYEIRILAYKKNVEEQRAIRQALLHQAARLEEEARQYEALAEQLAGK